MNFFLFHWILVECHLEISMGNTGSYMSAHVLLNLFNKLKRSDKMRGLSSILSLTRNVRFIYHMTLSLL